MAPLLVLVLGVLVLALLPRSARPAVVVLLVAVESAFVVRALTGDAALVAGGAIVGALVALLVREITATFRLLAEPTPELRRQRTQHLRNQERELTIEERELRRRVREERRERDRQAA